MTAPLTFALPDDLRARGYTLRPEADPDTPFLLALYGTTRAAELAQTGWPNEQKHAFILHQFNAQRGHYREVYRGARFDVIERDGVPVGRLYLHRDAGFVNLMDIALMPDEQNRGVGSAILTALIAHAHGLGDGVTLYVDMNSDALRLYRRFGFVTVGETAFSYEMICPAPAPPHVTA